ncbi:hypothetical protein ABZP36_008750 [Zizania latifolia]
METLPTKEGGGGDDRPSWVMFHRASQWGGRDEDPFPSIGDAKTLAASRTSIGALVRASFRLAAPPEESRPCLDFGEYGVFSSGVVAAQGNSVLIEVCQMVVFSEDQKDVDKQDYFVYRAGVAGSCDPSLLSSLSLLPPCYVDQQLRYTYTRTDAFGLLRHGDGEVVVAAMERKIGSCDPVEFELRVLRSGEWEINQLSVSHDEGEGEEVSSWTTNLVVPVGDRFLCWADYRVGVIVSDVSAERPQLGWIRHCFSSLASSHDVCVTGGGAVKFIDVSPHCCYGGPAATYCPHSIDAFMITAWTLRVDDDVTMTWVKDVVMTSGELWSLPGYERLRILLEYPVMVMVKLEQGSHAPQRLPSLPLGTTLMSLTSSRRR